MNIAKLEQTIQLIATRGKGILAADESSPTIKKRFDTINVESTEENRKNYRELLFTTPNLSDYISGVILFEETLKQKSEDGKPLPEILMEQGIVPGIKVDKGLVPLINGNDEKITQGLDGLPDRLIDYKTYGARFAKWRAVFKIAHHSPSQLAIKTHAELLARYAAICQAADIVPIVEPEVLMDGDHDLAHCANITEKVFHAVFHALHRHKVILEGIILKPSMVVAGKDCQTQPTIEAAAMETVKILRRTVPAAVPSIDFLSGGQSDEIATQHLNAINQVALSKPWYLSFSYGRALQAPALKAWMGQVENEEAAQQALLKRAKLNGSATKGEYTTQMESE